LRPLLTGDGVGQRRLGVAHLELEGLRVEAGEHVAALDLVAEPGVDLGHRATDLEGEPRIVDGRHDARDHARLGGHRRGHAHPADRARRQLGGGLRLAAGRGLNEQNRAARRQQKRAGEAIRH
jgi:hypothetical protein